MKNSLHHLLAFLYGAVILTAPAAYASAGTKSQEDEADTSGGFLKVGYGYKYAKSVYQSKISEASLYISAAYMHDNGLFVELHNGFNELNEGSTIGYNFYNTEHWRFDVNIINVHGDTTLDFFYKDPANTKTGYGRFLQKRTSSTMLGVRATGVYEQTTLQASIAPILLGNQYDDGLYADLWLSHSWNLKNWELYTSAGITYRNSNMLEYYYAILTPVTKKHLT